MKTFAASIIFSVLTVFSLSSAFAEVSPPPKEIRLVGDVAKIEFSGDSILKQLSEGLLAKEIDFSEETNPTLTKKYVLKIEALTEEKKPLLDGIYALSLAFDGEGSKSQEVNYLVENSAGMTILLVDIQCRIISDETTGRIKDLLCPTSITMQMSDVTDQVNLKINYRQKRAPITFGDEIVKTNKYVFKDEIDLSKLSFDIKLSRKYYY